MDDENPQPDPSKNAKDFSARPYQIGLFEKTLAQNSILYLPTGTGKTFIAVLLIKHMSGDVVKDYRQGGKRTIFIVPTVALVSQQTAFLNRHTGLTCKGYSGDMLVDFWTKDQWNEEIEKNQVMIMTAQIFVNILTEGIMPLNKVNLIIFDECHRASGDHPMRQIMQLFAQYPKNAQPRVLAMSASLLNANVKITSVDSTVKDLETTFQSKVITVDSLEAVASFATNPQESIVYYNASQTDVSSLTVFIDAAQKVLQYIDIPNKCRNPASSNVFNPKSKNIKLNNVLTDVKEDIEEMGLFGGSQSILYHLILLERIKRYSDDQKLVNLIDFLITQLCKIQKLLDDKLKNYTGKEMIVRNSTPKILQLMEVLRSFHAKNKSEKFCCIIFVQKRFTAKILFKLLKDLSQCDPDWEWLKPDFIVGYNNDPYKNPQELDVLAKWNKEALSRFRNGARNCLVATDVVDEGVDIPCCTLVVRYFAPMDFRAYIQSKGRARHSTSHFVILAESEKDYRGRYQNFQATENYLRKTLHGNTDNRSQPTDEEIAAFLYSHNIEPYKIIKEDGTISVITEQSALSLINIYCSSLIKSQFVMLTPAWILRSRESIEGKQYKVELTMPPVSPLNETIHGDYMSSVDLAKRSAAMKACIRLYEMGELLENLQPRTPEDVLAEVEYLFPCTRIEDKPKTCMPGTKAKKRRHALEYPEEFKAAYPKARQPMYLHTIEMKPQYEPGDNNRHRVFHDLLSSRVTFGILSTKTLPDLPTFPIFMNVGELQIAIKANKRSQPAMTQDAIDSLKCFQYTIFDKIVENVKKFTVFDENSDDSYLVVPLDTSENIDWEVVSKVVKKTNGAYMGEIRALDPVVPKIVENSIYDLALIFPSYRSSNVYIVTDVCVDKKAESPFPQNNYTSYLHYYRDKHQLYIKNPKQSLLEVKQISKKINCLKPRAIKPNATRKKRAYETEDFEEHMIPELCGRYDFPAVYWLKATSLPSILHRITQLLVAEKLRLEILPHMGALVQMPRSNHKWESLRVDETSNVLEKKDPRVDSDGEEEDSNTDDEDVRKEISKLDAFKKIANMDLGYAMINQELGTIDKDLLDIDRFPEEANLLSIEEEKKKFSSPEVSSSKTQTQEKAPKECCRKALNVPVPRLKILNVTNPYGPSPVDIMKSLTTKMSNDFFDLERVETLGDSFLKFAISNFLFQKFPQFGEGLMTSIKGKLVGNLNLFYCAERKQLAGRMKIEDFSPSNWPIPAFSAPSEIKERIAKEEIATSVLYEVNIPENQRISGSLTTDSLQMMHNKIDSWVKNLHASGLEHYCGFQVVADKNVSDCVEALIGTYLVSLGIQGALRILTWFEILPKDLNINEYLNPAIPNPKLGFGDVDELIPLANKIEENIGYTFKNRAFLLQAVTHPSYMMNRATSSYERLEFIGDAILDFLLTVHIYETCGNLSPGELTDLRSALVNNITFACLAVKYELHPALLMHAPKMLDLLDRFIRFQESRNYEVNDELLYILLEEEDCNMSEHVDVPKILGDIFESIIGAIFLDSKMNLEIVWSVIYRLMKKEIDLFSRKVPKQPIRVIYETTGADPKFSKTQQLEGTETVMVTLTITSNGEKKLFHGFGNTKKLAKCAASKQALKYLQFKK